MPSVSVDTNIIVHAADPGAGLRHQRAVDIVLGCAGADALLTQQVVGEFLNVLNKSALDPSNGLVILERLQRRMRLERTTADDLHAAFRLAQDACIQFWDAVIVTVCRRAKVDLLLTEDLQDGRDFDGVRIVNPLIDANQGLLTFLHPS